LTAHQRQQLASLIRMMVKIWYQKSKTQPMEYATIHLQPQNVHALCTAPVVLAQQTCLALTATAQSICVKHEKVMGLFSDCHQMYNTADQLTSTDADVLGMNLHTILCCYYCSVYLQVLLLSSFLHPIGPPFLRPYYCQKCTSWKTMQCLG